MEQQEEKQQVVKTWISEGEKSLLRGVGDEHMTKEVCEMDDSQVIGVHAPNVDLTTVEVEVRNAAEAVPEVSMVKRRRGRPPRNQGKAASPTPTPPKAMEEEDVCFICFDGGSLVLCDRRGCPKAYHPACIKRDEAFFQSTAKWSCGIISFHAFIVVIYGWHICSSCEKASHFMCYTCPYSLCKGCTKDTDYLRVRGNKGFCRSCMKMIMLIENVPLGNSEQVQVDFDDKTSWEYLFKVYWVCLKESLLLTVDEILKAKNPWQVDELPKAKSPGKVTAVIDHVSESSSELYYGHDEKATSSGSSYGSLEMNYPKRRKCDVEPKISIDEKSAGIEKSSVSKAVPLPEDTEWATKELLEFVSHVRNGDTSFLSQFGVQVLLFDYIERNNLRDPRRKCQILCDTRLINLFGKTRVGSIEMLKNLEYHFLVKENPSSPGMVDIAAGAAEGGCTDPSIGIGSGSVVNNDRRRQTCNDIEAMAPSEPISSVSSVILFPPKTTGGVLSFDDDELQLLWHYRDPFGTVQGPFPMMQLRKWGTSGLFPLDLRVWLMNGKEEESVLLTDALLGLFHKQPPLPANNHMPPQEVINDRSDKDRKLNCASSKDTVTTHVDENKVDQNGPSEKNDLSSMDVGNDEITTSKEMGSRSSGLTVSVDFVTGSNELDQNSEQLYELSKNSKSSVSRTQICDSVASPSTSAKVCGSEALHVAQVDGEENRSTGVNDVKRSPLKTNPKEELVVDDSDENKGKTEGCSSQSSGQSWHPTHMNISYGWDLNSTFPSLVNSNGTIKNEQEVSFSELGSSLPKQDNEDSKGESDESKYSASSNVPIIDAGPSWSTTSSLVGAARLPDVAAEWARYFSVPAKPSVAPANGSNDHAASPTSGAGELRHASQSHPSIDTTGWQAMVSEPNEFSFVDESVSDLLAEVEAMESLGGFPSPTSKLSCVGDVMHVSDNDCFSPVEDFSPAPVHGRSDALSSTGDIQMPSRLYVAEEQLGLSIIPSQPILPRESLEKTQKPPQLTVTEPFHISLMLSQPLVSSEAQGGTGPTQPRPLLAQGTIGKKHTKAHDAENSSNGHSNNASQSANSTGHSTTSTGNPSLLGSQPKHGSDKHSGSRDHQSHNQSSKDSGYGRERSVLNDNNRQSPHGGDSFRAPPKGQRVCKFYKNGWCKKGASCSFLHPSE
ncbi:Zinc finger CCCH domain-containing protein 44 [Linum perenne]